MYKIKKNKETRSRGKGNCVVSLFSSFLLPGCLSFPLFLFFSCLLSLFLSFPLSSLILLISSPLFLLTFYFLFTFFPYFPLHLCRSFFSLFPFFVVSLFQFHSFFSPLIHPLSFPLFPSFSLPLILFHFSFLLFCSSVPLFRFAPYSLFPFPLIPFSPLPFIQFSLFLSSSLLFFLYSPFSSFSLSPSFPLPPIPFSFVFPSFLHSHYPSSLLSIVPSSSSLSLSPPLLSHFSTLTFSPIRIFTV